MGTEFFQTVMGRKFYEGDVPRLINAIERVAEAVEYQNKLAERVVQESESPAFSTGSKLTQTEQESLESALNHEGFDFFDINDRGVEILVPVEFVHSQDETPEQFFEGTKETIALIAHESINRKIKYAENMGSKNTEVGNLSQTPYYKYYFDLTELD